MQVTTLEEAVSNMNDKMLQTLDLGAPPKVVKAKKRKPKPWYDEELKQQWKIFKNRKHKWFKYRENSHWQASLHQLIKQISTDPKMLFKLINELTGNKDHNSLPEAKSDKDLAEDFAQFFLNKIEKNKRTI